MCLFDISIKFITPNQTNYLKERSRAAPPPFDSLIFFDYARGRATNGCGSRFGSVRRSPWDPTDPIRSAGGGRVTIHTHTAPRNHTPYMLGATQPRVQHAYRRAREDPSREHPARSQETYRTKSHIPRCTDLRLLHTQNVGDIIGRSCSGDNASSYTEMLRTCPL